MPFAVLGLLPLLAILLAPFVDVSTILYIFVPSCLLMASAAIFVGGVGVTPAHLMLVAFLVLLMRQGSAARRLKALVGRSLPGAALVALAAYGVVMAVFYPRLFPGSTAANTFSATDPSGFLAPPLLEPSGANLTQSIYVVGSFSVFFLLLACCDSAKSYKSLVKACCAAAVCNTLFGLTDLLTYYSGTGYLMDFLHNGTYILRTNETAVLGLKRISGSFTETSAFSATTLGLFAFTFQLALRGVYGRVMLVLSVLELLLLLLSTSSTGLGGLAVVLPSCWLVSLWRASKGQAHLGETLFILLSPFAVLALTIGIMLYGPARETCWDIIDSLLLNKAQSESGIERLMLNAQAIVNFFDSQGFGIGIGSVRASSFAMAMIASVGVPGSLLFTLFIVPVLFSSKHRTIPSAYQASQGACRFACFALMVAACISATSMDLNLLFFVLAAGAYWPQVVALRLLPLNVPVPRPAPPIGPPRAGGTMRPLVVRMPGA